MATLNVVYKIAADISGLRDGVDRAAASTEKLVGVADSVDKSLKHMVDNFSGRKLIDEALLMATAVDKVGGLSMLTAAQLETVGAKATAAALKMAAMGEVVPPGLQKIVNAVKDIEPPTEAVTAKMIAMGSAVGTFVGHMAANVFDKFVGGAADLVSSGFKMNATLETSTLRFTTLMGDSDKAAAHVKDLFEIAKKTPFETGPIIEASLKLQTFGGSALNTKENIMLLGDASAATGAPINELGFWVGRLYSNLKGGQPFGEAAMRLQELGVLTPQARQEMEKLQASGKSGADVFDAFKGSLGSFTGAMSAQAGTWEGVMSTFTDTVNIMMAGVLKPYFEVIRDLMKNINDGLDGSEESFKGVTDAANGTKKAFADLVTGGGEALIKTVSFLMVEFNAAQVIFRDVAQVLEYMNRQAARLSLWQLKGSDLFGMDAQTQATIKTVSADIDKMTASIAARGKSLQANKQAEEDWVAWGDKAVAGLNEMLKGIGSASTALDVHRPKVEDNAKEIHKLTEEQKAYAKALADYNSVGRSAIDTVDRMSGAVVEGIRLDIQRGQALTTLARIYGVTAEQIKAIIQVDKDEQKALTDSQKFLDATIEHIHAFEKAGVDGAKAVALGMQGGQTVLRDLSVQMGDTQLVASKSFGGMTTLVADWSGFTAQKMFEVKDRTKASEQSLRDLASAFTQLAQIAGGSFGEFVKQIGVVVGSMDLVNKSMDTLKGGLKAGDYKQAASGILGIAAAMDQATSSTSRWGATLGGAMAGFQAGGVYGAAVGALIGWIRSAGAAERAINPLRQAFIDSAGGLDKLNIAAHEAGMTLDHLLQAKNADQYKAAFMELTAALEKHKAELAANNQSLLDLVASGEDLGIKLPAAMMASIQTMIDLGKITGDAAEAFKAYASQTDVDFKKMQDVAAKYKIDLDNLGKPFWAAKLHDAAQTLIDDFDVLTKNGANSDAVLHGMAGSISKLVEDSLKFGIAIPENMRPWIEQLLKTHQLIDENGKEITDLSGLDFAPPIVSGFDKIVNKLQELIDKLTGGNGVVAALDKIPGKVGAAADETDAKTRTMIQNWKDVGDEVDRVNFGHSPGGIKEIPIGLAKAVTAMGVTAEYAEKAFGRVYDSIDTVIDQTDGWGARIDDVTKKVSNVPDAVDKIIKKVADVPDGIDKIIKKVADVPDGIDTIIKKVSKVPDIFDDIIRKVSAIPDGIEDIIQAISHIPDTIDIHVATSGPGGQTGDTGNHPIDDPVGHMANGGWVSRVLKFTPRGTDSVPAMLTPGELVLKRGEAAAYMAGRGGANVVNLTEMRAELKALRMDMARRDRQSRPDLSRVVRDAVRLSKT